MAAGALRLRLIGSGEIGRDGAPLHLPTRKTLALLALLAFADGLLRVNARGGWETPFDDATQDYRELPVPASVRDAVLARARAAGEAALRLLEAASLAGDPFTLARLEGTTALSNLERVEAVEAALSARLIMADGELGYRFTHDLVAQALAEGLSPARARLLHRHLAATAEQQRLAPARVAAHLHGAGELALALPWRLRAAAAAEQAGAHGRALLPLSATRASAIALWAGGEVRFVMRASTIIDNGRSDANLPAIALEGAVASSFDLGSAAGDSGKLIAGNPWRPCPWPRRAAVFRSGLEHPRALPSCVTGRRGGGPCLPCRQAAPEPQGRTCRVAPRRCHPNAAPRAPFTAYILAVYPTSARSSLPWPTPPPSSSPATAKPCACPRNSASRARR